MNSQLKSVHSAQMAKIAQLVLGMEGVDGELQPAAPPGEGQVLRVLLKNDVCLSILPDIDSVALFEIARLDEGVDSPTLFEKLTSQQVVETVSMLLTDPQATEAPAAKRVPGRNSPR